MIEQWRIRDEVQPFEIRGTDNGGCDVLVAKVYGKDAVEIATRARLIAKAPEMCEFICSIRDLKLQNLPLQATGDDRLIGFQVQAKKLLAEIEADHAD